MAEGRIPTTQPFVFSADEGADVGMDGETAVSNDYIRQGIPPRQGPGLARGMRDAATHHAPGIQIAHSLIL